MDEREEMTSWPRPGQFVRVTKGGQEKGEGDIFLGEEARPQISRIDVNFVWISSVQR